jgi:photosystem II stability/assembly factor-like uncharacterized protein
VKTTLSTTIILLFTQFCFAQSATYEQDNFWMELDRPTGGMVFSLAVNSIAEVYAGMGNGVYLSNDDSNSWTLTGLEGITSYSLHIHQNGNIFAGTGGFNALYRMKSIEEGWTPILPSLSNNIISIMHTYSGDLHFGFWGGIYKSTNNGDTWAQTLELGHPREVASIIEAADGTMYAGISSWSVPGGGVYRSMDNGDSWEYVGLWDQYIRALETNTQGTLFAGSIGGSGVGIYSSDDNGETWAGLKNDVFVTSIVITHEDVIYIGCSNEHGTQGGVFRSFDNGETWEMINTGLIGWENQNVYGLTLSPDGYLYAYGRHLHRSVEPVFSSNLIHQPNDFQTAIYPNPFTSNLNISLSHNYIDSKNTIVSIYDVLGNIVFKQRLLRYSNHFTINTEFLKQGAYFLSIDANGKRYSKPIIKAL